jgi:hypothetical protein
LSDSTARYTNEVGPEEEDVLARGTVRSIRSAVSSAVAVGVAGAVGLDIAFRVR